MCFRGNGNHDKVSVINKALQKRGLNTWFDEDRMEADSIDDQMTSGIDNTEVVLVFITERYIGKVGGSNLGDNCKKEFNYAQLHQKGMIAVVMEEACYDKKKWTGPVGMYLGSVLFISFADPKIWQRNQSSLFASKIDESTPPLRLNPTGTSDLNLSLIDSSSKDKYFSSKFSSVP